MTTSKSPSKIEFWPLSDLVDYPKNAKKHPDEQIERLSRSILKLGVTPLQIEGDQPGCTRGMIISGHGRKLALAKLGRTQAPVIVRDDLSKTECDALRIADNAAVSNDVNYDLLGEEAIRLSADGFDMGDLGLTENEIKSIATDIGEIDMSAFTDDITTAVEEQKSENRAKEKEIDDAKVSLGDAFGFRKITTAQSRAIREFMSKIEVRTALTGVDALMTFINSQESNSRLTEATSSGGGSS